MIKLTTPSVIKSIVYDFDKKKNSWNWVVVNVNR